MKNSLLRTFFAALLVCARLDAQNQAAEVVKIHVEPNEVIGRISPNFIGFGYETSAVAQSNFFNATNAVMIQLYRNLSSNGLIRIGGIISDHTRFVPDGTPEPRTQTEVTTINRKNLSDLGGFARATGWKVMWGLNLGTGSKEEAVQEAMAVDTALGTNLHSFEIGNEVEALRRFSNSYPAYHEAYLEYKSAIRAALPDAQFSGPDSIGNLAWITNFSSAESRDIKLLTQHYYRDGAKDPKTSLDRLLQHDDGWDKRLEKLREIGKENGVKYRINEVNSFSGGGKPGVSDTLGSALWCLDYMFCAASHGCEGVNMETDVNQLGFISHYSPIVHDAEGRCRVRPEYYGMLAFAMAANGEMLKLSIEKPDINLTAYATKDNMGTMWITAINKDTNRDVDIEITLPRQDARVEAFRLTAPSIESKYHVTLGKAEVNSVGRWTPVSSQHVRTNNAIARLLLPHASAVLLRFSSTNNN